MVAVAARITGGAFPRYTRRRTRSRRSTQSTASREREHGQAFAASSSCQAAVPRAGRDPRAGTASRSRAPGRPLARAGERRGGIGHRLDLCEVTARRSARELVGRRARGRSTTSSRQRAGPRRASAAQHRVGVLVAQDRGDDACSRRARAGRPASGRRPGCGRRRGSRRRAARAGPAARPRRQPSTGRPRNAAAASRAPPTTTFGPARRGELARRGARQPSPPGRRRASRPRSPPASRRARPCARARRS